MKSLPIISALNRPDRPALRLNIGLAVGVVLAMNGLIFGLGWDAGPGSPPRVAFDPPGPLVGAVWVVLFALMGAARWRLNSVPEAGRARALVTGLIGFCLVYPLYSLAVGSVVGGLIGNVATVALASWTAARAWPVSPGAARLILPVIAWVLFATAVTAAELRLSMP